ncbi:MAG: DUF6029 family protein [Bacteroidales bacterium]|nr:DUF6029 family protein [Bacteroidales bacterium]
MKKNIIVSLPVMLMLGLSLQLSGQNFNTSGNLSGNMEIDFQTYTPDDKIGADTVDEKIGFQSFANLIYRNKNLEAGLRYEIYSPPLQGIDAEYQGNGIAHRYLTYRHELIEITAGHFYEQFGNGLTLRSYREWGLGYDNAIDGIRVKLKPGYGITLKGLVGKQRDYWGRSAGTIRGFDGDLYTNQLLPFLKDKKTKLILGGSFVSRFQKDKSLTYKIPENVGVFAARANIIHGGIRLKGEYARKINDPSSVNNFIYKPGEALLLEATYSQRGFGATVTAKRIDNMSFKSDYNSTGIPLQINFLPPLSKQHIYELASIYPYATQPNGEMGIQSSIYYMFKRKSKLGGKYGTRLTLDYSRIHDIERSSPTDTTSVMEAGTYGYNSDFFAINDFTFFEDISFGIDKKINRDWKIHLRYSNMTYDPIIKGDQGEDKVHANIAIADIIYSLKARQSLRMELQYLFTDQKDLHNDDFSAGDWAMILLEYNIKDYFFAVKDLYNYRNPSPGIEDIHYFKVSAGLNKGTNRIAVSYGRQREGINCVGGVCRPEPAANGFKVTITSSF